jgi:hypothetical protein
MFLTTRRRASFLAPLIAALVLAVAGPAGAAVVDKEASLTSGSLSEFDQTNQQVGTIAPTGSRSYDGRYAAEATYSGGGANGFSRGLFDTHWTQGDDVWYGGAFYLPAGFKRAQQGEVDLMRWDNWDLDPTHPDRCGVVVYGSDHRGRFLCWQMGVPNTQTAEIGPFKIPTGRWTWLEVHQRLDSRDGQARSVVFKNGHRVGTSRRHNYFGRPVTNIRFGIVAIDDGVQTRKLSLAFDRAMVGSHRLDPGPLYKTRKAGS